MNQVSNAFSVGVIASPPPISANKPGDATPPLAALLDPFNGHKWTLQNGIPFKDGVATTPRTSGVNRIFINLQSVWTTSPHGYSYWNETAGAWLWDGGHGTDGNFF